MNLSIVRSIAGLTLLGSTSLMAQINACSDPYWTHTLRCQVQPTATPQPVPSPPATVAQIKAYTRVDLPFDPNVRCLDGTRPIIYVDKAIGPPSNKWLIQMGGGSYCAAQDLDDDDIYESGQECLDFYVERAGGMMGTANEPAMSNVEDADGTGNGIMKPDPTLNPVFATYNRVKVFKCGFDRHSGRATHLEVDGTTTETGPLTYDLYNHGQKIVLAVLAGLVGPTQAGVTYTTWVDDNGNVSAVGESLPSMADAEQVVLLGHSAAGHGLYQNADRYAAFLRALPGFSGDVRAVHDAHFMHMAENEAAFDPAQNPDPLSVNTLFDQRYTGNSALFGAYDAEPYFNDSYVADDYRAWLETSTSDPATLLDASCVASHQAGDGDTWKCVDKFHVRLHHETTPALLREDFLDPNTTHNNLPIGYAVQWGPLAVRPECTALGFTPCPPVLTVPQNAARLRVQAGHFLEGVHTRSELATGIDSSGTPGSAYLWMPACGVHGGVYDDNQFYRTSIIQGGNLLTYREFVEQFVQAPASGVIVGRVTGLNGAVSDCGDTIFRDGFE